jgi:hypothetical protein
MSSSHAPAGCHQQPVGNELDADISELLAMLAEVPDPRDPRGVQYALVYLLAVTIVAVLAGATSIAEITRAVSRIPQRMLSKLGAEWDWFRLRYAFPSRTTIGDILTRIDADLLDTITGRWLMAHAWHDTDGMLVIALDGKVLRGAWTDANNQVTLFSAMLHGTGIPVAQIRVPDGTNEITQVNTLIATIAVDPTQPRMATLDAAHTQRETATGLKAAGWDYLMTVKGNQPTLQTEVAAACRPLLSQPPHHLLEEKGHGRIKRWSTWTAPAGDIDFPHLRQVAIIRRDTFDLLHRPIAKEFALIITSSPPETCGPAEISTHTRGQWGIENKVHWIRDVIWDEDHNQTHTGNTAQAFAGLKNLALGLLRLKGITTIKAAIEDIASDRYRALTIMTT